MCNHYDYGLGEPFPSALPHCRELFVTLLFGVVTITNALPWMRLIVWLDAFLS